MNDKEIEKQIHDIIEGEIQNNINEYLEENPEEQKGFNKDAKLNVNVSQEEVNKLLKKYKKMSKYMKSPLYAVKQMDGTEDVVSKIFDDPVV